MARPAVHLVVSTGLATLQWIRTGRVAPTVAPLVSGVLIDGDHFFEVAQYRATGQQARGRVVLPLHGWEFIPALYLLERLLGWRFAGGLLLGFVAHLIVDQFTNAITHPFTYFITFRARMGFPSHLFDHPDEKDIDWLNEPVWHLWKHF